MLDFNDAPTSNTRKAAGDATDANREKSEIRTALNDQLSLLVVDIWPSGKRRQNKYLVGDVMGGPGDSLELLLSGPKAGLWTDRATGEGGDILDLIARYYNLDVQAQFPQVLERAKGWLGRVSTMPASAVAASKAKAPAVDELGPATAKWDYQDASGKLIAVVYRYDPEPGRKEFRPWDVRRRKMAPPEPRPLYNQPGMLKAEQVVMVEGEKCAQALIDLGVCATTAMHGANAPVEKTDWSPLSGKHVLIWPDRDKPGWQYADHASQAIMQAGAKSCVILQPPAEKPEGWDVADAVQDGFDIAGFLAVGERVPVVHQIDAHTPMQLVDGIDYAQRFGNLTRAYELVGFHTSRDQGFIEINRRLRQLHPEIVRRTEETIAELGGSVRRDGKTDLLTLNDELVISLVLARCQTLPNGQHRWRIRFDTDRFNPDITVAVRLDPQNASELDYYLLPRLDLPEQEIRVCNRNSANFECFRFDDLNFFYGMSERERLQRKF